MRTSASSRAVSPAGRSTRRTGEFLYRDYWHDDGPKSVLGLDLPAGQRALKDVRTCSISWRPTPESLASSAPSSAAGWSPTIRPNRWSTPPPRSSSPTPIEPDQLATGGADHRAVGRVRRHLGRQGPPPLRTRDRRCSIHGPDLLPAPRGRFQPLLLLSALLHRTVPLHLAAADRLPRPQGGLADDQRDGDELADDQPPDRARARRVAAVRSGGRNPAGICGQRPNSPTTGSTGRSSGRSTNRPARQIIDFMAQGSNPDVNLNLGSRSIHDRLRSMVGLVLTSPEFHWR